MRMDVSVREIIIKKTRLFKYTENFTNKIDNFPDKKNIPFHHAVSWRHSILMRMDVSVREIIIKKTRLFKYTENFTNKIDNFPDKKILIFFIFLHKT